MSQIEDMLRLKAWAVVGANDNKDKFGFKIFRYMLQAGFHVYAVNPGVTEILGQSCYPTLKDLPEKPDAVDLVVPARVGEQVLRECAELGIKNVWLQPGADAPSVVKLGTELGLNVVQACIMVEGRKYGLQDA